MVHSVSDSRREGGNRYSVLGLEISMDVCESSCSRTRGVRLQWCMLTASRPLRSERQYQMCSLLRPDPKTKLFNLL